MLNYEDFVSNSHSLLIAPAGFGKTHTISECLKFTKGTQLILTHTHAGVASIRDKVKKTGVPASDFAIETITSFAQRYVLSFYTKDDMPNQENAKEYYPFIIEKAIELFQIEPIKTVIATTFSGLFVDEYQDCSLEQHQLILILSELFPTRILGDYLQGIFGFKATSLVDLQSPDDLGPFETHRYELETPWRWKIGGNELLGQDLKAIRAILEARKTVDLGIFESLELKLGDDIYKNHYNSIFKILNEEESLLILTPESSYMKPRLNFIQQFKNVCFLMESIDDKSFYSLSKLCDTIDENNAFEIIRQMSLDVLFNKTGINQWFNESKVKNKREPIDKALANKIQIKIDSLENNLSYVVIAEVLRKIQKLPGVKCYRKELLSSLCRVLEDSEFNNTAVYEEMLNRRNIIRRQGRKVYGKCVGTTLLTKGLEFDAVLIIDAHKFDCPKNLYVALTRASKRLIVHTKNKKLSPYTE